MHALRKRNGWRTGRTGQFSKGNIPHPDAHAKGPNRTSFKKGNKPHNYKPVGTKRLSKDGYLQTKVADPNRWEFDHHTLWLQHHADIPAGHCVIFTDGDKTNLHIENLQLVSRTELVRANQLAKGNHHKKLRPTFIAMGKLANKRHALANAKAR